MITQNRLITENPGSLLPPSEAEDLARELNAEDEDGWTYKVKHDPKGTGYSLVEVYDDENVFLGHV